MKRFLFSRFLKRKQTDATDLDYKLGEKLIKRSDKKTIEYLSVTTQAAFEHSKDAGIRVIGWICLYK